MDGTPKTITIKLTEEEHKEAKIIAAKEGMTLKDIFLAAIAQLRAKQEKNANS